MHDTYWMRAGAAALLTICAGLAGAAPSSEEGLAGAERVRDREGRATNGSPAQPTEARGGRQAAQPHGASMGGSASTSGGHGDEARDDAAGAAPSDGTTKAPGSAGVTAEEAEAIAEGAQRTPAPPPGATSQDK